MLGKKAAEKSTLDEIIDNLENAMKSADEESKTYSEMVSNLESLHKLRSGRKSASATELKDWIPVIGSVGGILLIVTFESFGHALTSKGVSFITKLRS